MFKFNWIKEYFLKNYIKNVLDKLPADGKKTLIGILLVILGGVASFYGHDSSVGALLVYVIEFLKGIEHIPAEQLGGVVALIGLIHKLLKKTEVKK